MEIDQKKIFSICPGFRLQWEKTQDAYVLLYPEGMVKLNFGAGEVMAQIDGSHSMETIVTTLENKFPETDTIADDVREFIIEAQDKKWISSD